MAITVVTLICALAFVVEIFVFIYGLRKKNRAEKISYLRGFKKGKFLAVYLTAYPLYLMGFLYNGQPVFNSVFLSIHEIVNLIVLKYEVKDIEPLMAVNPVYRYTVYFCFILVFLNAIIFACSMFIQYAWCGIQKLKALKTRKDRLYIFGYNPQNVAVYTSDKGDRSKAIIDNISGADADKLYMDHIAFISTPSLEKEIRKLVHNVKAMDREYIFVVNTGDEEMNIQLCTAVIDEIDASESAYKERLFLKLKVFVFGDPRYQAIYEDIISSGSGCIHYVNKYQKMAVDFIDRYPFSLFMDERQVDYDTSLIRDDVNINVALIGFGQTNQQVFLTSVANNQFLKMGEDGPILKKVRYFIFDKDPADNNKNLNHSYYRFKNECSDMDKSKYLPLPTTPAREKYYRLDINSKDFYSSIRGIVSRSDKDANFIVIAFGTDLENLDMAQKLVEKRKEWNLENLVIFVKVRVWHKEQTLLEEQGCYFIGNENDSVYDIEKIVGDRLYKMAKMRNETYALEYKLTNNPNLAYDQEFLKGHRGSIHSEWFKMLSQMERDSNLFGCLSLRLKLNLMNLDYCLNDANDIPGLTEAEYIDIYAPDDRPDISNYQFTVNGKKILSYGIDFKDSRRRNMAIHEHQRWNSFMISRGIVPSTRDQILNEMIEKKGGGLKHSNGKNYAVRRHGNLTTFKGLEEFRRMIAERDGCTELQADVIKYDYQILDDAHWLLSENGYKIIRKSKKYD